MVGVLFNKDPEQAVVNGIVYAVMGEKVWLHLERTGEDQIVDMKDITLTNPIKHSTGPDYPFFTLTKDDGWLEWNPTDNCYYALVNSPMTIDIADVDNTVVH